jgi:hypothetical protein
MGSKYQVDFKLPINLPSHKRPYMPFGRKLVYTQEVRKASLERLSHLIKVCGFLMQTKVYLFWKASKFS